MEKNHFRDTNNGEGKNEERKKRAKRRTGTKTVATNQ